MKALILALLLPFSASAVDCWQLGGVTIIPKIGGTFPTLGSTVGGITGCTAFGGINIVVDADVSAWNTAIHTSNGASRPNTKSTWIAQNVIMAIKGSAYNSKIVYLLPLLGQDLVGARMPLRDTLGKGIADALGDIDNSAFSESTGVQGNGSSKALGTKIKPSELGTTNNGGIGYWENNVNFTGSTIYLPMGSANTATTNYYAVGVYVTYEGIMYWGAVANSAGILTGSGTNGHFYAERSSSTSRVIFKNGSTLASNTTSDATSGASEQNISVVGIRNGAAQLYWAGRCALAYMTDGTMGSTNAAAFDTLLRTYLFTPTGRPSS